MHLSISIGIGIQKANTSGDLSHLPGMPVVTPLWLDLPGELVQVQQEYKALLHEAPTDDAALARWRNRALRFVLPPESQLPCRPVTPPKIAAGKAISSLLLVCFGSAFGLSAPTTNLSAPTTNLSAPLQTSQMASPLFPFPVDIWLACR